jgi:hypothetical protein
VGNTTVVNVSGYEGGTADPSGTTGTGSGGGGSGSGSGDPTINYSGSYTVRNTPEVIPPSVVGGNACAVGASGGMSMAGFGIAAGATWADKACERRQQAALLFNMGEQKVALELMCQDEHVRDAMRASGKPCSLDIAAAQPAPVAAPVAQAEPAARPAAEQMAMASKPDWCARASPSTDASKAYVAQLCGK